MEKSTNRDSLCLLTELALSDTTYSDEMKKSLIKDFILWKWTAGFNNETKFYNCQFWSQRAYEQWVLTRKKFKNGKPTNGKTENLRHDHVVPRGVVYKKLNSSAKDKIAEILDYLCVGCVITLEENQHLDNEGFQSEMPKSWSKIWARYEIAFAKRGITIYKICWDTDSISKDFLVVPSVEKQISTVR